MLDEAQRNLDVETALPFLKYPADDIPVDYMIIADSEQDHSTLMTLLNTSFFVKIRLGQVYWPNRSTGWQKDACALRRINMRVT